MFGELAVLDGLPRSAGAMTLERTVVYGLERHDFLAFLDDHPQLWPRILELVTSRLRRSTAYAAADSAALAAANAAAEAAASAAQLLAASAAPGQWA
jgi:CRP-like cAMP-binding protein